MTWNLKTFALAAACAMVLGLTGCGEEKKAAEQKAAAETKAAEAKAAANKTAAEAKAAADKMAAEKSAAEKPIAPAKKQTVTLGDPSLTAGIPGSGPLAVEEIKSWLGNAANHAVLDVKLPQGLDVGANDIKGLDKNPLTRAKIELGRQLYFDPRLSKDKTISCASCHAPDQGFAAHTQFGVGVEGQLGGRNSPVSYNRILSDLQFWDGRADSLEAQAVGPIANPIEMANTHETCVATVRGIAGYQVQFAKVFPGSSDSPVTIDNIAAAIASFERAIVTGPSPYDFNEKLRSFAGADLEEMKKDDPDLYKQYEAARAAADKSPMSDSAKRGRELFFTEKANCTACHVGPNLADEKYHNIGVGMKAEKPDQGRYDVTKDDKDRGAFKTPTIRNVALSAPYMHDGATKTLKEVVEFYAKGGEPNPTLDAKIKKLELTDQDKADLVAFMEACTGPFPKVETGRLPK